MANFGFIIDNRRCIGCHACTVACKSEHEVPIGVNRTWVKYIEKGEFPNSRRLFSVMRCNHCDNAPCVEICPVTALYRRGDGIVDFDNRRCIGCKACMQACPYDALYIDPQTHTAAKCNYCAHRIDVGLEPACVNVCPTQAIVSGDLDDPVSKISVLKSRQQVSARKTEKGTRPALFYIDGDDDSMDPLATEVQDSSMWGSQHAGVGHFAATDENEKEHALDKLGRLLSFGETSQQLSPDEKQGSRKVQGILANLAAQPRRAYDAPQKGILWGWQVSAYLWTKSIAAGVCMVPLLATMLSLAEPARSLQLTSVIISLVFLAITGGLLVWDLDKPARFLYVLLRPQWRSWLVRGAYIITAFAGLVTFYGALLLFDTGSRLQIIIGWPLILLAGLTAVYTAFLFAQALGRDFWQSPVLPIHMLTHAIVCGAALLGLMAFGNNPQWSGFLRILLIGTLLIQLLATAFELFSSHPTLASSRVAHSIVLGRYRNLFWGLVVGVGSVIPLLLLWLAPISLLPLAAALVLPGVFAAQHIWVRAPQQIPLSKNLKLPMSNNSKAGFIERLATSLKIIPDLSTETTSKPEGVTVNLERFPPPDQWDHWVEYDASSWPNPQQRQYQIVPTTCFNCESACGLLGYIDKETGRVRKFEGNPYHPGSRGRNCAKGPATINQINDTDRILYPLKREGQRGSGNWKRVSWDDVLDDLAERIRNAITQQRNNEIVYHVGRPGHEGYMDRVLNAWGVDGHNSHTNVCSSAARLGYSLWHGYDRPSPDHANARFILLISAHLESGHYFNPHAQRIIEGMLSGAKLAVMDPRLSNSASVADYWLPTQPGSEAAVLLAMVRQILRDGSYNREFVQNWVNWQTYMQEKHGQDNARFDQFIDVLVADYDAYTPEFAESESGIPATTIVEIAREIARAGTRFACETWRSASAGKLGGWPVARCLHFLSVLTGSVGTVGGTSPNGWNKFKPKFFDNPPAHKFWNELHFPNEYPLSCYEMSILLPHFLKEGRGTIDTYFTRVFNPVWSYPDGFSWVEALSDPAKIGCHAALTPTWNETAYFADYVLPMGHSSERHDLNSYETHSGKWIAFRQPILREAARRQGKPVQFTYESNPGEVWEEDEFWIELSWRIDHDGSLGIRKHFLSPYRTNQKITIEEYYRYIFENTDGLPEAAGKEDLTPLDYMRKYGAFEVEKLTYEKHLNVVPAEKLGGTITDPTTGLVSAGDGTRVGVLVDGQVCVGFETPSRKQEVYSQTMVDWKWPEYATPVYVHSQVHPENIAREESEYVLLPTFRLPTLIHSRSGNAKWLAEISNRNPLWVHTRDALQLGINTGDLLRVSTEIGHFVDRAWVTEAIRPGVIACSHHLGRWRRDQDPKANRWAVNTVEITDDNGVWRLTQKRGTQAYASSDPDSSRIFWADGGVHQNLIFPVQPDPVSGMQCWHQKVKVQRALAGDAYGDVVVDTNRSMEVYRRWLEMTRPAPGPDNLRRPLWLKRPLKPIKEKFYLDS